MKAALSCRSCLLQCPAVSLYTGVFLQSSLSSRGRGGTKGYSGGEGWRENCRWSLKNNFLLPSLILVANYWIFSPLVPPPLPHLLLIMLIITPFTTDFCQVGDCCVLSVNLFQIQLIQHIIGNFLTIFLLIFFSLHYFIFFFLLCKMQYLQLRMEYQLPTVEWNNSARPPVLYIKYPGGNINCLSNLKVTLVSVLSSPNSIFYIIIPISIIFRFSWCFFLLNGSVPG